ncbi:MAG: PIN domain-containing protein [Thermoplasmata archaeon]|nr:MAG: PIN domain-containing protein [Thermoplasmata archaeon]
MKNYIIDTMALVSYLEDSVPKSADEVFKSAEQNKCKLLIPEIVLAEFIYICLKGKLKTSNPKSFIMEVLISLSASRYIDYVGMGTEAWEEFLELDIRELNDRMICSIALSNNAIVITNDGDIKKNQAVETVWS